MNPKLKGIIIIILSITMITTGLMGCSIATEAGMQKGYMPSFKIIGDVEESIMITSMEDFTIEEIEIDGKKSRFLILEELIQEANPIQEQFEILLVGQDGLIAKIDGEGMETCYVTFSEENAWEFINPKHPISSNIKKVKEVVVIAKEINWDYGVNIISSEKNIMNITPGQLYKMPSTVFPYFHGTSSIETEVGSNETTIYTEERVVKLRDLIDTSVGNRLLAVGEKGQYKLVEDTSYLQVVNHRIDLIEEDGKSKITNVRGIMIDPPVTSIMDTYYDARLYLQRGERVLILFLDGLGYHQYLHAMDHGYASFFSELSLAEKATVVYESVTPAGFAAMITGKPPYENGIYSRDQRELKAPTIFAAAKELNKKSALIQGAIGVLNTEIQPTLNTDRNNNGSTDDEVFETAMEKLQESYDLLMVHFKDIDRNGHSYGDMHENTMEVISITDNYVKKLVEDWEGKVIITSDHGMHSTSEGGNHGAFRYEDMVVPYIVMEGGGKH